MKNYLKLFALAVVISFAACKGKDQTSSDTTKTEAAKQNTPMLKASVKKPDSEMVDVFDKNGNKIKTIIRPIHKDSSKKDSAKK
jgi:hypothetical protein